MTIILTKGQRISLEKEDHNKLENFCIGVNWGAIQTKGLFGGTKIKAVDLDLSVEMLNANKESMGLVYYGKLKLPGIKHSGDDLVGDEGNNDDSDNEVISISLNQLPPNVQYITILLNSYNKIDFKDIPFASIRLYEGTPGHVQTGFAKFKIDNNDEFAGCMGMILGSLYKHNDDWKFNSIGTPVPEHKLKQVAEKARRFL